MHAHCGNNKMRMQTECVCRLLYGKQAAAAGTLVHLQSCTWPFSGSQSTSRKSVGHECDQPADSQRGVRSAV